MDPDLRKTRDLTRMKWTATGLLVAMAALLFGVRPYEPAYPWLGFVRAFAEAGLAGGIADWFAVTALFRHPLGLRLPHTAIIPANKRRIAENLGNFFERNFLVPDVVAARLAQIDLSGTLLRWIGGPQHASRIAGYLVGLSPMLLDSVNPRQALQSIQDVLVERLRAVPMASVSGVLLAQVARNIDYHAILVPALEELTLLFRDNRDVIQRRVRESTGWLWQRFSLDEKVADAVIRVIETVLEEVRDTPDHPWMQRFEAFANEGLARLDSPPFHARLEAMRDELLAHPMIGECVVAMWTALRQRLEADIGSTDSVLRARVAAVITQGAAYIENDAGLRERLDLWCRNATLAMIESQRHQLAALVAETVQSWDTATVTRKLELEVGSDLQYVRINGTLIGGVAGLGLHALQLLA